MPSIKKCLYFFYSLSKYISLTLISQEVTSKITQMPPKASEIQQPSTSSAQVQPSELEWKDRSLGSVPISIIKYCLFKANQQQKEQQQQQKTHIPKRVTVHLSHGKGIKYRSDNLVSIDDAMNVRLQNVVMSRAKKIDKNTASSSSNNLPQHNLIVTARTIDRNNNTNNSNNSAARSTFNFNDLPFNEQLIGTRKDVLLLGTSIAMIELPEEWAPIFEEQAKEVRREYYRRERAANLLKKENKKKRVEAAKLKLKEKKEKRAKKEELMKKGAKRAGKK